MLLLAILLHLLVLVECLPMRGGERETSAGLIQYTLLDELIAKRASKTTSRIKATTVTQSINNWIEDVDTVNSFLNVALNLPPGPVLKAGASKALSFAQDEPVNNKFLGKMKGLDSDGIAAAATLDRTFGDVLVQLGNVVDRPASLPVAINAVTRINVNRCENVLPSAETLWKSAATLNGTATKDWPPKANREIVCPGKN